MANYNLFDAASLAMIPTGVKEDKVYSIKPTDGSGDLAFLRSLDTATRVNSSGLIEKVRTNVLLQSNSFDTTWGNGNTTETGGQSGYDGSSDAWLLDISGGTDSQHIGQNISVSGVQTFSFYAKAGSKNWVMCLGVGASFPQVYFDLQNGVVGTESLATGAIVSVGNGWYRCSMWHNMAITSVRIYIATADNDINQSSGNIYIQDAQLETGDIATDYIATTSAAVSVGPVANLPRLDYSGGASCPKLLLEPQRTNYQLYSENSAQWVSPADGLSVAYNTTETLDPSGYYGAEKVTAVSGNRRMYDTVSNPAGAFTVSVFVKLGTGDRINLTTTSGSINVEFNLLIGAITNTAGTGSIVDYGNGWYRCIATATSAGSEVIQYRFLNDAGEYVYFWGAQAEAGAYATSYIPTLSAASTRGADVGRKIGLGVDDSIGQTEGTIFVDLVYNGSESQTGNIFAFNEDTSGSVVIIRNSNGVVSTAVWDGSGKASITGGSMPIGQRTKIAYAYKSGSTALFVNGTQIGSDNTDTFSLPLLNEIHLNSSTAYFAFKQDASFNQTLLFKTRLTNAELAALTTI